MQTQIKQLDFSGQNFYCGFDTHKKNWTVTIETDEFPLKTFTQNADPEALVQHLRKNYPGGNIIAGYEAGYFGYGIQRKLESMGINCIVIHPADIPTTNKDKDQKRDPIDSRKIARALKNKEVSAIWIPPVAIEEDRQLLRTRRSLAKDQTRTKNRIKAFLQMHGIKYPEVFSQRQNYWSARFVKWLQEIQLSEPSGTESLQSLIRHLQFLRLEILVVSRKIRALSKLSRYEDVYLRLIKIKGIGLITAMTLITEIGDIHRFKNPDAFRSFIGLVPSSRSSGEKDYKGRITRRANSHLRYLLVEAAWIAIRRDPNYLHIYKEYRKRMKDNKALIRTAGKLANRIYYCMKIESEK
jgi:transposase